MVEPAEAVSQDGGSGGAAPSAARRKGANAPRTNVAALEACHQLLLWLVPTLEALPRRQKFLLGDRTGCERAAHHASV